MASDLRPHPPETPLSDKPAASTATAVVKGRIVDANNEILPGTYIRLQNNEQGTIYAGATNLLNQPLRYYIGGNKDCTTQVEYYGAKVNFGVKFNL